MRKPIETSRKRLGELLRSQDFDAALQSLAQLEHERQLTSEELVLRGRCIQLSSANAVDLSEAEKAFHSALELDNDYVPALLELGWFYFAVEDDTPRALPPFEKALEVSTQQLRESATGKAECLEELASPEAKAQFLEELWRSLRIET